MRCNFAPASAPCRDSYCPGLSITYPVLGTTDERQMAFDLRNHCARSGTRTTFRPLKTLGTRENIRNPKQFDGCTTHSEAESVDIVHTPFRGRGRTTGAADAWKSGRQRSGQLGRHIPPSDPAAVSVYKAKDHPPVVPDGGPRRPIKDDSNG